MEEEQYRALMDAISTSKKEVEGKLTETLEKLRREVTEVQERTSKDISKLIYGICQPTYQN